MNNQPITSFDGQYSWLSNMACTDEINYNGLVYQQTESAYQAQKTLDEQLRKEFCMETGYGSKRKAKTMAIRPDWNQVKLQVMEDLLRIKFNQEPFKSKLINTGNRELIEGNTWRDTFWGVCNGVGENNLGKLLMKIRSEFQAITPTMTIYNVAVIGSRKLDQGKHITEIYAVLDKFHKNCPINSVVSGGANGPDKIGAQWARDNNVPLIEHIPDWSQGKSAGFKRNELIIKDCNVVLAFWDGISNGTQHSIKLAQAQGKPVFVNNCDGQGTRKLE